MDERAEMGPFTVRIHRPAVPPSPSDTATCTTHRSTRRTTAAAPASASRKSVKSEPSRVVCPRATPIGIGYPDRAAQDGEPVPNLADSLQQRPTQETAGRLWIQTADSGNSECEPADSGSFRDTHQAAWKAPPACPPRSAGFGSLPRCRTLRPPDCERRNRWLRAHRPC
jgi:hypothetical protein